MVTGSAMPQPVATTPLAPASDFAAERKANQVGFVSLFNGKDLTGWADANGGTGNWKVIDGVMTCSGSPN